MRAFLRAAPSTTTAQPSGLASMGLEVSHVLPPVTVTSQWHTCCTRWGSWQLAIVVGCHTKDFHCLKLTFTALNSTIDWKSFNIFLTWFWKRLHWRSATHPKASTNHEYKMLRFPPWAEPYQRSCRTRTTLGISFKIRWIRYHWKLWKTRWRFGGPWGAWCDVSTPRSGGPVDGSESIQMTKKRTILTTWYTY